MSRNDLGPRPVTRAQVARRAGVSTATVSYTLNETKVVSEATRAKVLAAVDALGYRPNAAARALKVGSTAQLGLVVPGVLNRFFAEITDHAELAAANHGRALMVTSARHGAGSAISQLAARQVDGVLLAVAADPADLTPLAAAAIPVAAVGLHLDGVASVDADRYQGARRVVEHLIGHGHRRIGFIGPDWGRRRQGWADALDAAGLPAGPVFGTDFSRERGYRAGRELAAMADGPTAVFVSSDDQAIGVLLALHESGLRVPEDVAVGSFDGSQEAAYCWPPLTTAAQPIKEMVLLAVEHILNPRVESIELAAPLVPRASCGCPRPARE